MGQLQGGLSIQALAEPHHRVASPGHHQVHTPHLPQQSPSLLHFDTLCPLSNPVTLVFCLLLWIVLLGSYFKCLKLDSAHVELGKEMIWSS